MSNSPAVSPSVPAKKSMSGAPELWASAVALVRALSQFSMPVSSSSSVPGTAACVLGIMRL